jgi:hypothetical protein
MDAESSVLSQTELAMWDHIFIRRPQRHTGAIGITFSQRALLLGA